MILFTLCMYFCTSCCLKTLPSIWCFLPATAEDYKLLEQMNKVTTKKYTDMKQMAIDLEKGMKELNEKCKNILVFLFVFVSNKLAACKCLLNY